ncbi:MAG: hypothetical protein A2508_03425 [Candidatus Lambdaproteobacteria bacterium RIFOXYD12_FULL_49_8]|uniref:Uncharacterized protein n=1 Tax=Candidatus Lambdaproteobacteria bacterium RIFOXYD2_FULL_50_16 TaxID=1817772 RepID=A0A1F6GBT9_9PROT|nr:MAG: hypothetical protein A2527_06985 [Candidatus Lambdaproteobacteria bacterium RIFOXYD2_FULL_50_16]OGG96352.1 MAG: hypothetical protein A2508_03425 [Candidatus Lambdaproteobacteria bacterium RIFOXYD12_FULL_49_8]
MDEEKKYFYNPYTGTMMNVSEASSKGRQEIGNSIKDARNADPELLINVGLILFLQLLLFKFLTG